MCGHTLIRVQEMVRVMMCYASNLKDQLRITHAEKDRVVREACGEIQKREDEIRTFKETSEYREARLADDVKYLTEKYVKYRVRFYAMRYLLLLMSRQVEESYPAAMVHRLAHCPSCFDALVNPCQ